jgi:hypothetical protein
MKKVVCKERERVVREGKRMEGKGIGKEEREER